MKTTSPAEQNMFLHTHLRPISELTSRIPQGVDGEYISELAICGSKNECDITVTVYVPISEVKKDTQSPKGKNT